MIKVVVLEAKTDQSIDDDAVAQVIGYFLASSANYLGVPLIAIIISQQMARLVFFPFQKRGTVFANAVVTNIFSLFHRKYPKVDIENFGALVVYVSRYITTRNHLGHMHITTTAI